MAAVTATSRQEVVGAHQGKRTPRPQGQAADTLRREDASGIQADEG